MTTTENSNSMASLWHTRSHGDLIAAVAESIGAAPRLDDAGCKGSNQWDAEIDGLREVPADREARLVWAASICRTQCPALAACAEWVAGLPQRERPHGVVAGQVPVVAQRQGWAEADVIAAWLGDYLHTHGRTPARDVTAAAAEVGIKARTLRLAATRIGVVRGGEGWGWQLPEDTENGRVEATQPRQPAASTITTTKRRTP